MDGSCGRHARVLWLRRVSTGRLNRFLAKLGARISGGGGTAKEVARLKYLTQVCVCVCVYVCMGQMAQRPACRCASGKEQAVQLECLIEICSLAHAGEH